MQIRPKRVFRNKRFHRAMRALQRMGVGMRRKCRECMYLADGEIPDCVADGICPDDVEEEGSE